MDPNPHQQNDNANGWGHWLQQEGDLVVENELIHVNNLADIAVANAVANGLMQHPDQHQNSGSTDNEEEAFYRAQGPPITLELPLPVVTNNRGSFERSLVLHNGNVQALDNDFLVREMARSAGLHQVFGPSPSVECCCSM